MVAPGKLQGRVDVRRRRVRSALHGELILNTAGTKPAITLALSKGRIFDETLPLLKAAGISVLADPGGA